MKYVRSILGFLDPLPLVRKSTQPPLLCLLLGQPPSPLCVDVLYVWSHSSRRSPDKSSRDSGVITPSDGSEVTSPESEPPHPATYPGPQGPPSLSSGGVGSGRKPSDPLPQVGFT